MADLFVPDFIEETPAGIFARHAGRFTLPVLVAPTTRDREAAFNRLRKQLLVVACANLKEYFFEFDSSVLAPKAAAGFESLMRLLKLYPGCPISLFGHADPVGKAQYNKSLSERRARSVFGLLLRRVEVWEHLYTKQDGAPGDRWGTTALQTMLLHLRFDPGEIDGTFGTGTREAMRAFLDSVGAGSVPAQNVKPARAKLFLAYMDALAPVDPDTGAKWKLAPADFLAGAKAALGEPGDLQGCSEFNPQLVFAKEERKGYAKGGKEGEERRNLANEPNRRVVIYVFEKGTTKPANWPCPAAKDGIKGCEDRFWSDAKERRETEFVAHRRRFGREVPPGKAVLEPPDFLLAGKMARAETTFGCRFYHGFALHSPCERDLKMWVVRLWAGGAPAPLKNARYAATVGTDAGAPVIRGVTSASGILALPLFDDASTITLRVDATRALVPDFPDSFDGRQIPKTNPNKPPPPEEPVPPPGPDLPPGPGPEATPLATTTDAQAWPGEEHFLTLVLDAGALERISGPPPEGAPPSDDPGADFDAVEEPPLLEAEKTRGAAARLRDLAFGGAELEFDDVRLKAAVREFQLSFRAPADATGLLDDETIEQLQLRFGEQIKAESPPR